VVLIKTQDFWNMTPCVLVTTDLSEALQKLNMKMYMITIFRVTKSSEYLRLNVEAPGLSETSVTIHQSIQRNISDDWHLYKSTLSS
jgi:hypothetical protein